MLYDRGWSGINIDLDFHTIDFFNFIRKRDENINIAISEKEGEKDLYFFHNRSAINSLSEIRKKEAKEIKKIKAKTLNSIIENSKFKDEKINLLSIDVEGHEFAVLHGAVMTLKESSPLILFEINIGEVENGSTKAKEFLHSNDYTYFYDLKDISPFANTSARLSKFINALSVLFFGKKLRGELIPHRVIGKLNNKSYPLILASKDELPFE